MCVNTLLAAPFIALVPAMAEKVFEAGARGTSILVTAQGIGAVLMGFALGTLTNRFGIRRVVVAMLALLPPALLAYASSFTGRGAVTARRSAECAENVVKTGFGASRATISAHSMMRALPSLQLRRRTC